MLQSRLHRDDVSAETSIPMSGAGSPLVAFRDVVKTFETSAGPFQALRGVSLGIDAGEFVAITGRSGSSKSTLINTLTGIDRPTSGEVVACGVALHELDENQLAIWRGRTWDHLPVLPAAADPDGVGERDAADGFRWQVSSAAAARARRGVAPTG